MSDTQEPKPQKINRLDPAWAMFAAAYSQRAEGRYYERIEMCADYADAMIRERDRRDREEQNAQSAPGFTATPWQYIYRSGRYKVQQCNSLTPLAEIAAVGCPEMSAANARLMAASPEMYYALEECIAALYGAIEICGDIGNLNHAKKLAEDAMQKATYSKPANDNPGPSWNPYGETDCQ